MQAMHVIQPFLYFPPIVNNGERELVASFVPHGNETDCRYEKGAPPNHWMFLSKVSMLKPFFIQECHWRVGPCRLVNRKVIRPNSQRRGFCRELEWLFGTKQGWRNNWFRLRTCGMFGTFPHDVEGCWVHLLPSKQSSIMGEYSPRGRY